jgi:hypothetical protein
LVVMVVMALACLPVPELRKFLSFQCLGSDSIVLYDGKPDDLLSGQPFQQYAVGSPSVERT